MQSSRSLLRRLIVLAVALYAAVAVVAGLPPYPQLRARFSGDGETVSPVDTLAWPEHGRWWPVPALDRTAPVSPEQRDRMEELQAIGYLSGSEPAPQRSGVTVNDPEAEPGWNLYNSGEAPEAVLMDMAGHVRHRWHLAFRDAFPKVTVPGGSTGTDYWRRVYLYPNGDLLAVYEGLGLVKIDRDSRLLWAYPGQCHHDLFVDGDGDIHVLTRVAHMIPRLDSREPVLEDFITVLSPDGTPRGSLSVLETFENSRFHWVVDESSRSGDIFHSNTLEILDGSQAGRSWIFREGNALVSLLKTDVIAVLDPAAGVAVWAVTGPWDAQHQPTLLPDGNLLIFDNRGYHGASKVIEFDPLERKVVWSYEGDPPSSFFSYDCGSAARLPGGHTLITESNRGRAFEITPDQRIVWEFLNPARAGAHGEFIATLFEMQRLPLDFGTGWLAP